MNIFFAKELYEIHSGFLSQLNCVGNDSHSIRLSEVFLKWSKKFLVYASYCANLSKACSVLQEKCENEEINQCVVVSTHIEVKCFFYRTLYFRNMRKKITMESLNSGMC